MEIPRRRRTPRDPLRGLEWLSGGILALGVALLAVSFLTDTPGLATPGAGMFLAGTVTSLVWLGLRVADRMALVVAARTRRRFPTSPTCQRCQFPVIEVNGQWLHQTRKEPAGIPYIEDTAVHMARPDYTTSGSPF